MADPTREQLEAELSRLNAQLASGVVRVQGGSRSQQFDLAEVRRRRDEIRDQISDLGARRPIRALRVFTSRDY